MASTIEQTAWHAKPIRNLSEALATADTGLSSAEAEARLRRYEPNRLPHKPPPPWWSIGLRQFQSPLIYILAVAAVVSLVIGHEEDAGFIAVLLLNAMIGGYQEWKAERSSQALQRLLQIRASVLRDGEVREIDAEAVVPGDIVWLESGNRVPADLRLAQVHGLEVDESLLTGEPLPVSKDPAWIGTDSALLADRRNMATRAPPLLAGAAGASSWKPARTAVGQLALDVLGAVGAEWPEVPRLGAELLQRASAVNAPSRQYARPAFLPARVPAGPLPHPWWRLRKHG